MTKSEMRALAGLIISGLIFFWFQQRMLDGWNVVAQSPGAILEVMVIVVVASIVGYAISEGVIAGLTRDKTAEDERDALINSKAMRNELVVIVALVNIFAFHIILNQVYGASPFSRWARIDLSNAASVVFYLFSLLWIGEWVRQISVLVYSRSL